MHFGPYIENNKITRQKRTILQVLIQGSTEKYASSCNSSRIYNLLVICRNALPQSYKRLVEARTIK